MLLQGNSLRNSWLSSPPQNIPAYMELCYDYGWSGCNVGRNKPCCCGAANCKGNLYSDEPPPAAAAAE